MMSINISHIALFLICDPVSLIYIKHNLSFKCSRALSVNVRKNYLWILLKFSFWFFSSLQSLKFCITNKLPSETDIASLWSILWVARI